MTSRVGAWSQESIQADVTNAKAQRDAPLGKN